MQTKTWWDTNHFKRGHSAERQRQHNSQCHIKIALVSIFLCKSCQRSHQIKCWCILISIDIVVKLTTNLFFKIVDHIQVFKSISFEKLGSPLDADSGSVRPIVTEIRHSIQEFCGMNWNIPADDTDFRSLRAIAINHSSNHAYTLLPYKCSRARISEYFSEALTKKLKFKLLKKWKLKINLSK